MDAKDPGGSNGDTGRRSSKKSADANNPNASDKKQQQQQQQQLASLSELFSLSTAKPRTRPFLAIGLIGAFISGCVYPAVAFYFAAVFEKFVVPTGADTFMDGIREMAYAFMILGVILFAAMSAQNTMLDAAAADMAQCFQRNYLALLLRQDIAYFDLTDVAGTGE